MRIFFACENSANQLKWIIFSASFHRGCIKSVPESCFLQQFNIPKEKVQPFGFDDNPKEILVWHTKTRNIGTKGGSHGYIVE